MHKSRAQLDSEVQQLLHRRRNELNKARLGLALAQKQLECGRPGEAEQTLANALAELDRLEKDALKSAASSGKSLDAAPMSGSKCSKRALIVEDNENERELLAGYLRLSGFQVDTASNGLEAIKYLQQAGEELPQAGPPKWPGSPSQARQCGSSL